MKHIDNINDYVLDLVKNGAPVITGKKTATVQAEQGTPGQVITTEIDKTTNTVKVDENGNPDWVVTNPGGERYVVTHDKFTKLYEAEPDKPGEFSKKATQMLVPCNETVEFTPSWGGSFTVEKGGYFTINGHNDIAGIQKEAFDQTYRILSQDDADRARALSTLDPDGISVEKNGNSKTADRAAQAAAICGTSAPEAGNDGLSL